MTTPKDVVDSMIEARMKACEAVMLRELQYVGESCVNTARDRFKAGKQYRDRTGNLTSSMGYVIVGDGRILKEGGFSQVSSQASAGVSDGRGYAESLVSQVPGQGYTLIVVAGMSYAIHVSNLGYDVLDSAELLARRMTSQSGDIVNGILNELGL